MMKEIELSRAVTEEAARCLLCYDAPCAAACPLGRAPDHLVRSLVLGNPLGAIQQELSGACPADCARHCMKACLRAKIDLPIRPIVLRFVHDIASCPELAGVPISGIGGITTAMDALDFLALGATNLQVVTVVMEYGYRIIDDLADGLSRLLDAQGSELADVIGSALSEIVPCDALDRQTIRYPSFAQEGCIGCGRCYVSCEDGGHQAIHWQKDRRRPILDETRCVGCQLCRLVCPVGAIEAAG